MTTTNRAKLHVRNVHSTNGFTSYCGLPTRTPGGRLFPGVEAMPLDWFLNHPYPSALEWKRERGELCERCLILLPRA